MTQRAQSLWVNGPAANAWQHLPGVYLSELLAVSGADAVTLDLQHGMIDLAAAKHSILAIEARGAVPLVRVPGVDEALIAHLLDAGAVGIICATVESADQARQLINACHYPPLGTRSFGPNRAKLSLGDDYFARSRDTIITFAMIETVTGLDAVEEIAAIDMLTGLFIGPGDLGISMGLQPGQDRQEAELVRGIAAVSDAAKKNGKRLGIHANSPRYAAAKAGEGFDLVTAAIDTAILSQGASGNLNAFRKALAQAG